MVAVPSESPGDAVEGPPVLVVNLTLQEASAPRVELGRRNTRAPRTWRAVAEIAEVELLGELRPLAVKRCGDDIAQNETEEDEAQIAVDRLRSRRVFEWERADGRFKFSASSMVAEEG